MKLSRLLLVGALVALALPMLAAVAKADGLPPGDPFARTAADPPLPTEVPEGIFSTNFTITCVSGTCPGTDPVLSPPNPSWCVITQPGLTESSPSCFFQNDIAVNGQPVVIDELTFDFPGYVSTSFDESICTIPDQPAAFAACSAVDDGYGGTVVTFSSGAITTGEAFFVDLEGFTNGVVGSVIVGLPEPGTLPMLGIGLVALLGLTRKRLFQQVR